LATKLCTRRKGCTATTKSTTGPRGFSQIKYQFKIGLRMVERIKPILTRLMLHCLRNLHKVIRDRELIFSKLLSWSTTQQSSLGNGVFNVSRVEREINKVLLVAKLLK
jgi:hypothetical protein